MDARLLKSLKETVDDLLSLPKDTLLSLIDESTYHGPFSVLMELEKCVEAGQEEFVGFSPSMPDPQTQTYYVGRNDLVIGSGKDSDIFCVSLGGVDSWRSDEDYACAA